MIDQFVDYYHTEDEIIEITNKLKDLIGKPLLSDENELFMVKDFNIEGINYEQFNWFRKRKEVRMYYIDTLTISNTDNDYTHKEDDLCTLTGLSKLWDYRHNYSKLELKLTKFTMKNNISLNFNNLN